MPRTNPPAANSQSVARAKTSSNQASPPVSAETVKASPPVSAIAVVKRLLDATKLSTLWYLSYSHGESADKRFNRFSISRGYVTLGFKFLPWFDPRVTLDTHQDDDGNWEVRLKYLYGKFVLPLETVAVTEPFLEFGLVHTPWFDFEEHVNRYRAEGTMFIERNGVLNSADLGATVGGLIGRKLPVAIQDQVGKHYPGTFGSFAFGIYNGGGYHAKEENNDKVWMSRVTIRPLGLILPHLQLSYFLVWGRGNKASGPAPIPDWRVHDLMLSVVQRYFVLTGQYAQGRGNQAGTALNAAGEAAEFRGFSFFGEVKLPWIRSSLMGRYDYFDRDLDAADAVRQRLIAGYAFFIYGENYALLSMDRLTDAKQGMPTNWQVKLTLQVRLPP
jgi:hypothetical protein